MASEREVMEKEVDPLLQKFTSDDEDSRWMACQDLEDIIVRFPNIRFELREPKLVAGLLDLLFDKNPGVQSKVIQCFPGFCQRLSLGALQKVLERLANDTISEKTSSEDRDTASMVLINVLSLVDESQAPIVGNVASLTIESISKPKPHTPVCELLSVLGTLLARFSGTLAREFRAIQGIIFTGVLFSGALNTSSKSYPTVKSSIACLGSFVRVIPEDLFDSTVTTLLQKGGEETRPFSLRIVIQALGSVCRAVGHRLGRFMDKVVPLIVATIRAERFEDDHELRDQCFKVLASIVGEAPRDVQRYLDDPLLQLATEYLNFDPNRVVDDDDDNDDDNSNNNNGSKGGVADDNDDGWARGSGGEDGFDDEDLWGGDGAESEEEFPLDADPDDKSWQVRKAAASLVSALSCSAPRLLPRLYETTVPRLIACFDERVDHVRTEVFAAFLEILRQTSADACPDACRQQLRAVVPSAIARLIEILKNPKTSLPVRTAAISIVSSVTGVATDMLCQSDIDLLLPEVFALLQQDGATAFKITLLELIRRLLQRSPSVSFNRHFEKLSSAVRGILRSKHSKQAVPQALRAALQLISAHRSTSSSSSSSSTSSSSSSSTTQLTSCPSYLKRLCACIKKKLDASDVDQEVKELSIGCAGMLLSILGAATPDCTRIVDILVDRLRNEITRMAAVKAIEQVCSQPSSDVPFSSDNIALAIELTSDFLRKNSRPLRLSALRTLPYLLRRGPTTTALRTTVITEASRLLDVHDLQLCHFALQATIAVMLLPDAADVKQKLSEVVYPRALLLVGSPLVQGQALQSLVDLFGHIVRLGFMPYESLLDSLLASVKNTESLKMQSLGALPLCVGAISSQATPAQLISTVDRFLASLSSGCPPATVLVNLMCLGEVGRLHDLATTPSIVDLVVGHFDSHLDENKHAASTCLGQICLGSSAFLQRLLALIDVSDHRYLVLQALRLILGSPRSALANMTAGLLRFTDNLLTLCGIADEGLRNLSADCLGRLALLQPDTLIPRLFAEVKSTQPNLRAAMLATLKALISDRANGSADHLLQTSIADFWAVLDDAELVPRKAAILALTQTAHRRPELVRPHLAMIQTALYKQCPKNKELVRIQVFGPYRNEVDDGLPIRKAAFECMAMLLENFVGQLDLQTYLACLALGLDDACPDIKMLCHVILSTLSSSQLAARFLIAALPSLLSPLRETLAKEGRELDVKQDQDRHEEQVRSALKSIAAIHRNLPGVHSAVPAFRELIAWLRQGILANAFHAIATGATPQLASSSSSSSSSR